MRIQEDTSVHRFFSKPISVYQLLLSPPRGEHRMPSTSTGDWVPTPVESCWGQQTREGGEVFPLMHLSLSRRQGTNSRDEINGGAYSSSKVELLSEHLIGLLRYIWSPVL